MKFDAALEDAVRRQARPGTAFTDAEVRQALHWAVDHAEGVATPLDGWMTQSPVGRAAVKALEEYEPAPPKPPSMAVIAVRCALIGAGLTVLTLVALLLVKLAALLVGLHPGFGVSLRSTVIAWIAWTVGVWLTRTYIPPVVQSTDAFPVPRQRDPEPRLLGTLPPPQPAGDAVTKDYVDGTASTESQDHATP